MAPCNLIGGCQGFDGTYCLHLQMTCKDWGRNITSSINDHMYRGTLFLKGVKYWLDDTASKHWRWILKKILCNAVQEISSGLLCG